MKIELADRHAEHVDESLPLCDHRTFHGVRWGDTFTCEASFESPGWLVTSKLMEVKAEVEVHLVSENFIRIIVNHADYLAAKKAAATTQC